MGKVPDNQVEVTASPVVAARPHKLGQPPLHIVAATLMLWSGRPKPSFWFAYAVHLMATFCTVTLVYTLLIILGISKVHNGHDATAVQSMWRKRDMMAVLMKSTNMAPMMGTMRKGLTV